MLDEKRKKSTDELHLCNSTNYFTFMMVPLTSFVATNGLSRGPLHQSNETGDKTGARLAKQQRPSKHSRHVCQIG